MRHTHPSLLLSEKDAFLTFELEHPPALDKVLLVVHLPFDILPDSF